MDLKAAIATNFSASAPYYDRYALMQQQAACALGQRLTALGATVPNGPILEVGCGTGAVSRQLAALFPERRLTLIDLAPGMIEGNRAALIPLLTRPELVDWQVRDAETLALRNHYALITSCLALQWFTDLTGALRRLGEALIPGGLLLCSYLGDDSFPEWREACHALGLPCTINPLPNGGTVVATLRSQGLEVSAEVETIRLSYPTALEFFRSLKRTGTSTRAADLRLSRRQMARLLAYWQQAVDGRPVTVSYQVNTFWARK